MEAERFLQAPYSDGRSRNRLKEQRFTDYGDNRKGSMKPKPFPRLQRSTSPSSSQPAMYQRHSGGYTESQHTFDFDFGGAFRFGLGAGMGCIFALPAAIILAFIILSALGISLNALFS